jgi:hypothetical protein
MRYASEAVLSRLTTAIGHDIECGSRNAFHAAVFCCVRLVSKLSLQAEKLHKLTEELFLVGETASA